MKELARLGGYTLATLAMIFAVVGVAKSDVSDEMLAYSAIIIVVVLPVIIGILMARKEKANSVE